MAINKKLIHFKTFANFNSQKLSANEANTKYTTGVSGTETTGNPDVLYQSICFIKDTQQIWTHGCLYSAPSNILNIIEENELVTAGALADLDDRLKVVEEGSGGGDYLPLTGGILTGNLSISQGNLEVFGDIFTNSQIYGSWDPNGYYKFHGSENGLAIDDRFDDKAGEIIFNGDGTKVLTDDLSYKTLPTNTSDLTNDSGFITANDTIAKANQLTTGRNINGNVFNGSTDITNYTTCTTGASTTAKAASISTGFTLKTGSQVRVKFSTVNTASAPTLNIQSTGAKRMSYKGSLITNANFTFNVNKIYTFTYDGTYWVLEGDWDTVDISGKQDKINDLEDIRQGASLGKTSVQSSEGYAITSGIRHKDESVLYTFSGSVNELEGDYIVPVLHEGFVDAKGIYDDANEFKFTIKHSDWESEGDYVIPTMEEVDAKQDTLVSGTNIKTVNGESILGSGDLSIDTSQPVHFFRIDGETSGSYMISRMAAYSTLPTRSGDVITLFNIINQDVVITSDTQIIYDGDAGIKTYSVVGEPFVIKHLNSASFVLTLDNELTPIVPVIQSTSGSSSNGANVQAVAIGESIDGVEIEYATTDYVDGLIGDINSVLESIING